MVLAEEIASAIEGLVSKGKLRRSEGYISASLFARAESYEAIEEKLKAELAKLEPQGELIALEGVRGRVKEKWVALYLDENPSSPWWAEERG